MKLSFLKEAESLRFEKVLMIHFVPNQESNLSKDLREAHLVKPLRNFK